MYEIPAIGRFLEDDDFVPPVPPAARRLKPGEVLVRRWTGKGFEDHIERRPASAPLPAAASSPRPDPPRPRSGSLAGPAGADGGYRYVWVQEADVPFRTRQAGRAALLVARDALLGGRMPELRWFRPALEQEEADFTEAGDTLGTSNYITWTVGLRSDVDPWLTRETVLHEAGHLANLPEAECERLARDLVLQGL